MRPIALVLVLLFASCIDSKKQAADSADTAVVPDTAEADDTIAGDTRETSTPDVGPETSSGCGDHKCQSFETRITCPVDCGCGNGICEAVETLVLCPEDCCGATSCGDCTCDSACGETIDTCPRDCFACGDGKVTPGEIDCGCTLDACRCPSGGAGCGDGCCMGSLCDETPGSCPQDCGTGCGNATCDAGETPLTCDEDCSLGACGNGLCEATNDETPDTCPSDCAAVCGNCLCELGETYLNCPPDCGLCGDGVCSNCPQFDEREHCVVDCGN